MDTHRGLDAGCDVQHGAAWDVPVQGELQRPGDVLDVGVVTRCRAVPVDHDRLACLDRAEEQRHRPPLMGAPGAVHVREPQRWLEQMRKVDDLRLQRDDGGDVERVAGDHHQVEAIFKAFARALRVACARDARLAAMLPSTKGLL